tara:strand:- start:767 stop:970 length:204 start_codon:yes stop_codon:yes gene_type:complete
MTDSFSEDPVTKKIIKLEALREILLNEDDIIWDEVNATERDLNYLKQVLEVRKKKLTEKIIPFTSKI